MHPHHTLVTWRIIFNALGFLCLFLLVLLNFYLEKSLEAIESISIFLFMSIKCIVILVKRETLVKILENKKLFWKLDVEDDQISFLMEYIKQSEKLNIFILVAGMLIFMTRPFIMGTSSIFHCYVPHQIPFSIFYIIEFYILVLLSFIFVSFNMVICSLVLSVTAQFRLLNIKLGALDVTDVTEDEVYEHNLDLHVRERELKERIMYHQFLIRFVEDLNKILSEALALKMFVGVCFFCGNMYIITLTDVSHLDRMKVMLTTLAICSEYLLMYGLPLQFLMDQSAEMANVIYYELKWYLPQMLPLRKYFLMMILRSQKSISIKAANYHVVNNQTVLLILKTAYTFYTFLLAVTRKT